MDFPPGEIQRHAAHDTYPHADMHAKKEKKKRNADGANTAGMD
jgi:hypothetical protein